MSSRHRGILSRWVSLIILRAGGGIDGLVQRHGVSYYCLRSGSNSFEPYGYGDDDDDDDDDDDGDDDNDDDPIVERS